jgi:signal transduction histidine kinase
LDVLKIIRRTANLTEIPVILISALNESEDVARGIRLGANDYITKPINVDVVQARVNSQIILKTYSDERRRVIARLQTANALKARLMQVASHDLKNPLNNLRMLQTIMQRASEGNDQLQRLVQMMGDSVVAMTNVVDDILDRDAANDEGLTAAIAPIAAHTVVQQVLSQYAIAAHNKNITFRTVNIGGTILGDEKRLVQVLGNLVSNAIKYSPPNTTVTLTAVIHEGLWQLNVADQGPGIPDEEHELLFEPFRRGSPQPTAGETSTGLGLWIVREMMLMQGGSVGVECPPEGGSVFWIQLPVAPEVAAV